MIINAANISTLFKAFNAAFTKGQAQAPSYYKAISTLAPSGTSEEQYGWLGQFPKMREWIGPRILKNLTAQGFSIKNRTFENTVSVPRTSIEDDKYGLFSPIFQELGKAAAEHPDELVLGLLKQGFTASCYDGQFFFDTDHPVTDESGAVATVSNMQAGAGSAWYLLDTSRAIKPMIFQERVPYELTALDKDSDGHVFYNDEYVYGVRARCNAGFGLWQLAFASKDVLNAANYEAARAAMRNLKGDEGRPLNIIPDTLVVPPSLEGAALRLLNTENGAAGATNEWKGTAKLIVTQWVA